MKPRPRLNPAAGPEHKVQKKKILAAQKFNKDPKNRLAKKKARKAAEKLWLGKVRGTLDRKGKPKEKKPKNEKKKRTHELPIKKRKRGPIPESKKQYKKLSGK